MSIVALWAILGWGLVVESGPHPKAQAAEPGPRSHAFLTDTCFVDSTAYGSPWVCLDSQGRLVELED